MSTSVKSSGTARKAYTPNSALAKSVEFDSHFMHVNLTDGRIISVPLIWFPTLRDASLEQRTRCEIGAGGQGLHWPDLDEDLSIAGLMAGVDSRAA